MGTTSAAIASAALEALSDAGVRFAFLHAEEALARGTKPTDLDLVVDREATVVVARSAQAFASRGLYPVMVWVQDVGGGACVFYASEDARQGVQLDLLFDRQGLGKYGLRSQAALDTAAQGVRWDRLHPTAELLYLVNKRHWKADRPRLEVLLDRMRALPVGERRTMVRHVFAGHAATLLERLVDASDPLSVRRPLTSRQWMAELGRWVGRVRHPTGYWVDCSGDEARAAAAELVRRFGRLLPYAFAAPRPLSGRLGPAWWLRHVVPLRYRAGLIVSWSSCSNAARADLCVQVRSNCPDDLGRQVVGVMCRRVLEPVCR